MIAQQGGNVNRIGAMEGGKDVQLSMIGDTSSQKIMLSN